jgi:hypothetical protein
LARWKPYSLFYKIKPATSPINPADTVSHATFAVFHEGAVAMESKARYAGTLQLKQLAEHRLAECRPDPEQAAAWSAAVA